MKSIGKNKKYLLGSLIVTVLVAAVFPILCAAQEKTTVTPDMVVTATRYEEAADEVPTQVLVVTREDIVNSTARDIPGILRQQAGVHVMDISGNQRTYRVDLRGFGETAQSNTLILVDGRRINQPDLSGSDWALIPLDRVERIEVIKGGRGSVLYGDNAAGGVVNIITSEGSGAFAVSTDINGGSYGTASASVSVAGTTAGLSYAVNGSVLNADGYRENSDSERKDLGLDLGHWFGPSVRLNLSAGTHEDETRLPGGLKQSELDRGVSRRDTMYPGDFSEIDDDYIQFRPEYYFLENSMAALDLSYRKRNSMFFNTFSGGTFTGNTEIETVGLSPSVVVKEPLAGMKNSLIIGADWTEAKEEINNTSVYFGFESTGNYSLEKQNTGVYIHDELSPIDPLAISAGYRRDRAEFSFAPGSPSEATMDEDLFTAGASYRLPVGAQLYVSYSKSFRYPVLDELFNFFSNTVDTGLSPQNSDDLEIGLRWRFSEAIAANINLFRIDTEDEIFYNAVAFANENLDGETRRQGVEAGVTLTAEKGQLTVAYAYTDATIRDGVYEGSDIPNVPEHKFAAGLTMNVTDAFTVGLEGIIVGKRPFESDFANSFDEQDDYAVLNVKLQYRFNQYVTAYLDVRNADDEEYSEYGVLSGFPTERSYYPAPERNVMIGLRGTF